MKKNIRDHDIEGQYRTVLNPYIAVPLTAILKKELVRKYGLFFHIKPPYRGDENTRPGFDNWRSQLDRRRACEESARRASAASQSPPHRHLKERAHTKVRAFFSH
ncbi:hypothetical protein GYD82_003331, partial [Salmonella enterica]|nr:hypothetical protein [Salmonella enterica]